MNLVFLHIGDFHISRETNISEKKIEKISSVFNSIFNIDEIYIICTGDLAYSCKCEEYDKVTSFFEKLKVQISEKTSCKKINIIIVPGNHDICLEKKQQYDFSSEEIKNLSLENELKKMNNFFQFSEKNKEKYKSFFLNDSLAKCEVTNIGDNKKCYINLINTVPFSSLDHDDKDNHYISTKDINEIKSNGDLNIVVMHHNFEWFKDEVRLQLRKSILNNDILFLGHEHYTDNYLECHKNEQLVVSRIGEFNVDEYNSSYFNVLVYNIEDKYVDRYSYSWNKSKEMFICDSKEEKIKIGNKNNYYSKQFIEKIKQDEKVSINKSLFDYYVFPNLEKDDGDNVNKIHNYNELKEIVMNNNVVSISGDNDSGRTSLLRKLYIDINEEKFSLYLDANDIYKQTINSIISNAVHEQIDDPYAFDMYNQLSKDDRVIFIDNFDMISEKKGKIKENLLIYLKSYFSHIILVTSDNLVVDLKEEFKDALEFNVQNIRIKGFSKKQRRELVAKLTELQCLEYKEDLVLRIDNDIKNMPLLSVLGNTFILNYINITIKEGDLFRSNYNENNFNVLFEQTLIKSIMDNAHNIMKNPIEIYLKVLELLAYKLYLNKKERFNIIFISETVKEYNERYGKKVNSSNFVELMVESRIFKQLEADYYMFVNKMYLSYFIASKIRYDLNNGYDISRKELNNIIQNICFGINGDILLFIVYLSKNMVLIEKICESALMICSKWDEFSFDKKNINILYEMNDIQKKIKNISDEDISEIRDIESDGEIKFIENYDITCDGIFDYDDADLNNSINQLNCLQKFIELLSRGIYSFNAVMEIEQQKKIIKTIYSCTNKFIYKILSEFDQEFDDVLYPLKKSLNDGDIKNIRLFVSCFLNLFIYTVYSKYAFLCTNSQTYDVISKVLNTENNEDITKKIFNLIVLDNTSKKDKFNKCLNEILDGTKDGCVLYIIKIMLINRFICRDFKESERTQLIDKYNNKVDVQYHIDKKGINLKKIKNSNDN